MKQYYDFQEALAEELAIPMVYSLGNSRARPKSTALYTDKKVNSVYAFGQIAFRDQVFLDFTGRNDWSSTLPSDNNSYFYPSISSSVLLGDMLNLPTDGLLSFAKLRLSWAQVGNDTSPYQLEKYYNYAALGGSVTNPTVLPNSGLQPEITTSYELGTNLRFFNNKVNLDLTTYSASSRNQILDVPLDISTGFGSAIKNAGLIVNRGIEISLRVSPIRSVNGLSWSVFGNWATNKNEVKELGENIDTYLLTSMPGGNVEARVGEPFGNIYGQKFLRSPEGEIVYWNGVPQRTEDLQLVGNINPDWTAGVGSEFIYRNFSFNILFNGKKGGDVLSLTHGTLAETGGLIKTLPYRYEGVIGDGVKLDGNGNYVPNDIRIDAASYWRGIYNRANAETNTFDTSFIKLGEVRMAYKFPSSLLKTTFLNEASLALVGRDLYIWSKWPLWDPEASDIDGGSITPGIERGQLPSTRSVGLNLNLKF
jgi:outer membrane receptor protein involved in Fe transport